MKKHDYMKGSYTHDDNPRRYSRRATNCIAYYRQAEGLSIQTICRILGVENSSAKKLCESAHSSAKYIHILALREGLSDIEFQLRYAPVREDAA